MAHKIICSNCDGTGHVLPRIARLLDPGIVTDECAVCGGAGFLWSDKKQGQDRETANTFPDHLLPDDAESLSHGFGRTVDLDEQE